MAEKLAPELGGQSLDDARQNANRLRFSRACSTACLPKE